jgi:hypothetical protein
MRTLNVQIIHCEQPGSLPACALAGIASSPFGAVTIYAAILDFECAGAPI